MKRYDDEFPLLQSHGLYAADIRGDGNCLFNALSDQVYGHQNEHRAIRARVIDHMRENADYYKQFIDVYPGGGTRRNPKRKTTTGSNNAFEPPSQADVDRVFESHLEAMAQGGTYGDNMEITAFSRAYNISVKIYQRDVAFMITGGLDNPKGVAHIAYHTWEHYSSIRNIDGPHTGLPTVEDRSVSPDSLTRQSEALASAPLYQPWQVKQLSKSLPYIADEATIHRALEQCRGNMDATFNMLLGDDSEARSVSSSTQDSSSAEREHEDDKRGIYRHRARQNKRRSIRLTKTAARSLSQDSGPGTDSDNSTDLSSSGAALSTDELSGSTSGRVTTRLTLSSAYRQDMVDDNMSVLASGRPTTKRAGPLRMTARDKKELKKQAQKAARKQRQQELVGVPSSKLQAGMAPREKATGNTPPIESGLRTLFI